MALQDVGVVFISKGFQNFISNLGKANRSITDFGNMTKNKIQALRILNDTAVILSNDFKKMQTSADRVAISQQRTAQSANYLKTAQEKVKISANNATSSYNKWQKSINDASIAASRAAVNLKRLDVISQLNDALVAGTIDLEKYTTAALATNNQLRQLGETSESTADTILNFTHTAGNALAGLGGIFSSVAKGGNIGAQLGGAIGSIVPAIGTAIGGIVGYLAGALAGLGAGILKWIAGLAISIGKSIINLGKKVIGWIGSIFKSILGTIKGFLGTIFNMLTGGIFQSGWNNLGNTIVSSMFKFEILKEAIRKVVTEINGFISAARDGAIELQTFTARLNFLINSQVVMADSSIAVADAWNIASDEAQRLLTWIQKLSLSSPMDVDDISKTVSMAIAMGWTVDSAKELTLSILDYTAAVGLGSEESERIIYNFAQMKNQGKVTGTELRDLGRGAFIPINKVLEIMYENLKKSGDGMKYANMSFEEFRKQAAAGTVDVEGFFTAFQDFVNIYMPGAMEKMNYTFKAVSTRLKNLFKTLLGWDVLGPLIVQITKPIDNLIKKLSTDQVITNAKRIGAAMALMFNSMKAGFSAVLGAIGSVFKVTGLALPSIRQVVMAIVEFGLALKKIGEAIGKLIEKIFMPFAQNIRAKYGSTFSKMRNDFFSWGAKLVLSFAQGMMRAAASALIAVMKAITKLLTAWLKPHSPPQVAPDIDKWGAKTIDEYYGGFTDPTPAVVDKAKEDIADTTKDIVDSASKISMPNLNFGAISLSLHTFSQADFESLDAVQSSLKDILSTLATLGQITTEESGKMFASMSEDLINGWAEFNKTGKISIGIFDRLRSLGGVWGTELAELLDLQLQLAVAVEQTAIAQKAYDDAVKASIRAETKVSKLIKDYNNVLRKGADRKTLKSRLKIVNASEMEYAIAKKAEETKKTELDLATERQKIIEDQVKLQESLIKQMTELVQAQKDAAGGAGDLASAVDELGAAIGDIGFDIEPPWTDADLQSWISIAQSNFSVLWKDLSQGWNDTVTGMFGAGSAFQTELGNLKAQFAPAIAELKGIWDDFAKSVGLPSAEDIMAIWNKPTRKTVTTTWEGLIPKTTVTTSNTFVDKFMETIKTFQTTIEQNGGLIPVLTKVASYILTKIGELMTTLANDTTVTTALSNGLNALATFMNNILTAGGTGADTPIGKLSSGLASLLTQALNIMLQAIGPGTETWTNLMNIGGSIVDGIIAGIYAKSPAWLRSILLGGIAPSVGKVFGNQPKNPWEGMTGPSTTIIPAPTMGTSIGSWGADIYNMLNPSQQDLGEATTAGNEIGVNIFGGMTSALSSTVSTYDYSPFVKDTKDSLNSSFDAKSPAKTMYPVGENLAEGIAEGMLNQINKIIWIDKVQPLIDAVKNVFGIAMDGPSKVFDKIGQSLANGLADGIEWVLSISTIVGGKIYNSFEKVIDAANQALGLNNPTTSPFYLMGQNMIQGLIDGFEAMIPTLIEEWNALVVSRLPADIQDRWEISSPSKLFMRIGENAVKGLQMGLEDFSVVMDDLVATSSFNLSPIAQMSAPVQAPPVYGGTSVTFGDTYINNDMDWAVFKSRVQRAITER